MLTKVGLVPKPESSEVTIQAAPAPEPEYIVREWTKEDQKNSDELERTANFIRNLDGAFTTCSEIPFLEAYGQLLVDEAQQKDKK